MTKQEQFFRALAKLVQPDDPEAAYQALRPMAAMLTSTPERVWQSRQCLEAIAIAKRRTIVPSYADLASAIGQWLRDNPDTAVITDDRMAGWSDLDHKWLAFYTKRKSEGFLPRGKANLVSLLRGQAPTIIPFVAAQERVEPGAGRFWYEDTGEAAKAVHGL
jgi:hypothetical protein